MVKTLLKSVREYKKSSILCPLFMIGEAAMEILIPWNHTELKLLKSNILQSSIVALFILL